MIFVITMFKTSYTNKTTTTKKKKYKNGKEATTLKSGVENIREIRRRSKKKQFELSAYVVIYTSQQNLTILFRQSAS